MSNLSKLRESERKFRTLAERAPVVVWMTDTAGTCTYLSQYWYEFTGRDPAQDLGFAWSEAVHPEDRERAARDLIEATQARRPHSGEYRVRRANGEYAWFHDMGVPYFHTDGSYAGYIGACVDITGHKRQAGTGQRVRQSLLLGQETERKRLAGELHDGVSQQLVLTGLAFSEIQRLVPAGADGLKDRLRAVRDQLDAISSDIHRLSHNLHPATVVHLGLAAAMNKLCGEFSEQAGINVEFVGGPMPGRHIEEDLAVALFRIAQEALTNVVKHSRSQSARVSLREREGLLHLAIADQGVGFDVDRSGERAGLGLASMRERAWLIGAELRIQSTPSTGTHIDLRVPLSAAKETE